MCLLPLLIPTNFIKKGCWWLRQLMVLGVGWQDCQSSPTRTLHQQEALTHSSLTQAIPFSSPRHCCYSRTSNFASLSVSCSPSRRNGIRVPPHAQEFPGFTPLVFFCGFVNSVAVSFTHGLIHGFCIVVVHALVVRL